MTLLDQLDIFAGFCVSFEENREKFNKYIVKKGFPEDYCVPENGVAGRFVIDTDERDIYIWAKDEASVYHELLHATFRILRAVGVHLCEESEETYTYLFTHLVRKFKEKFETTP